MFADDGQTACLVGIDPREMDVREHLALEPKRYEDDVLGLLAKIRLARGRDLERLAVEEMEDDRDIVRSEIPERVHVLPNRP